MFQNFENKYYAEKFIIFVKFKTMDPKFLLIIQDSIDIYCKYGIKSVSMEDLCKELKISKNNIQIY